MKRADRLLAGGMASVGIRGRSSEERSMLKELCLHASKDAGSLYQLCGDKFFSASDRGRTMLQEALRTAVRDAAIVVLEDACSRQTVKAEPAEPSPTALSLAELKIRQLENEEKKWLTIMSEEKKAKDRRQAQTKAEEAAELSAQWKKKLLKPGEQEAMDAKKAEAEATTQEMEQLREEEQMWQEKAVKKPKDAEPELERIAQQLAEMEAKLQQLEEESRPRPRPEPRFHESDAVLILQRLMSSRVKSQDTELVKTEIQNNFLKYVPPCQDRYIDERYGFKESYSLEDLFWAVSLLDRYVDYVHRDRDLQAQGAMTLTRNSLSGSQGAMTPTRKTLTGSARMARIAAQQQAYREACKLTLPEQPPLKSFLLSRSSSEPGLRRETQRV